MSRDLFKNFYSKISSPEHRINHFAGSKLATGSARLSGYNRSQKFKGKLKRQDLIFAFFKIEKLTFIRPNFAVLCSAFEAPHDSYFIHFRYVLTFVLVYDSQFKIYFWHNCHGDSSHATLIIFHVSFRNIN